MAQEAWAWMGQVYSVHRLCASHSVSRMMNGSVRSTTRSGGGRSSSSGSSTKQHSKPPFLFLILISRHGEPLTLSLSSCLVGFPFQQHLTAFSLHSRILWKENIVFFSPSSSCTYSSIRSCLAPLRDFLSRDHHLLCHLPLASLCSIPVSLGLTYTRPHSSSAQPLARLFFQQTIKGKRGWE